MKNVTNPPRISRLSVEPRSLTLKKRSTAPNRRVGTAGCADWALGSADWALGSADWALGSADCALGSADWALGSADWASEFDGCVGSLEGSLVTRGKLPCPPWPMNPRSPNCRKRCGRPSR
ncbi:Uncharacterised protein [Mycobacteroides abscessus subsp. abscessus]|nr:Uncharacterised protein [Mycobacteroides abscessus subsp. abscessus]